MSERISSEEISATVRSAVEGVFSAMLQLPLEVLPSHEEAEEAESFDGVVALVGIAGSWSGTGRIACSPHFACRLAGALLMQPYEAVDEEVLDAVAEVANMIIGNVKTSFEEKLGPLGLSIPTVIFGRNYRTHSAGIPNWTVIPFNSEGDAWHISFCLIPTKMQGHQAPRPDAVHVS
jgi:chemotaxis protein CheX